MNARKLVVLMIWMGEPSLSRLGRRRALRLGLTGPTPNPLPRLRRRCYLPDYCSLWNPQQPTGRSPLGLFPFCSPGLQAWEPVPHLYVAWISATLMRNEEP